jgi:hypothetical protein
MAKNKKHTLDLGQIELGEKVIVSDPCYTRGTWCHGSVEGLLPGKYNCIVTYSDEGSWGERVSQLTVHHESVKVTQLRKGEATPFSVGVDSGQAGIFCDSIYPEGEEMGEYADKESFYGTCCNATTGDGYENQQRKFYFNNEINMVEELIKELIKEFPTTEEGTGDRILQYHKIRLETVKEQLANHVDIPWTQAGLVFGKGVVSSSGYGDGGYGCKIYKKDGKVIGIRIIYL